MKELSTTQMESVGGGYVIPGSYRALIRAINRVDDQGVDRSWLDTSVQQALQYYSTPASKRAGGSWNMMNINMGARLLSDAHWRFA